MTDLKKITIISDRWLQPLDWATPADLRLCKKMQEWREMWPMPEATENFFFARHEDGRIGALLELELDDDFVPTAEHIAAVGACTQSPGEFQYVPPGQGDVYNDRAAYWVFLPGAFFNTEALEETALNMNRVLYP